MVSTKGALTQEQQAALAAAVQQLQAGTVDMAQPTPPAEPAKPDQPAPAEAATEAPGPVITFAQVNTRLAAAKNQDALVEAADLIGEVHYPEHRTELAAIFEQAQQALGG